MLSCAAAVSEQVRPGTAARAGPAHPRDKGLVLFIRLLPDGQKLLIKVVFSFHPCKWLSKSANCHGINVICIVVCEFVCFVGSF